MSFEDKKTKNKINKQVSYYCGHTLMVIESFNGKPRIRAHKNEQLKKKGGAAHADGRGSLLD